ncbi:MAG: TonB family protein [Flavobacteriaceae bacterium]
MLGPKINLFNGAWVDTIFEGRNKEYGAYVLRKENGKVSVIALIIGAVIFSLAISTPVIMKMIGSGKEETQAETLDTKIVMMEILEPVKKPEEIIHEPVVQKQTKTLVEVVKHVPPVIVEKETVEEEMKTVDDFKDKITGAENIEASDDGDIVLDNTHSEIEVKSDIINDDQIYVAVEVKPEFPGGIQKFYDFVKKEYKAPNVDRDLKGNVIVEFVVEKDGSLTDIKVLRDIGHGTGAEAIRTLKKSRKWNPGIQNGVPVRVRYTLPIAVSVKAQ